MAFISINETKKRLYKNGRGQQFYLIDNPYAQNGFNPCKLSEAIRAIIEGYGDQIMDTKDGGIVVVKYIDKSFGAEVRQFSLEKYKDYDIKNISYCLCIEGSWGSKNYLNKHGGIAIKIEDVGSYDSHKDAVIAKRKLQENEANIVEWYGKFEHK